MDLTAINLDTPLGIALVVIGIFVAFKAVKTVVKLVMIVVVAGGLYLWLGGDGGGLANLNPF